MPPRFFHGGVGGLDVGDRIQPREQTGAQAIDTIGRRDRVYMTTKKLVAGLYGAARAWEHEDADREQLAGVYEVRPVGPVEHDPDTRPGTGVYMAEGAEVVRVIWNDLRLGDPRITRLCLRAQMMGIGL